MEQARTPTVDDVAVADVMTAAVVSLDPAYKVGRARELMLGVRIHGLPVMDDQGMVVGIVTSTDLVEEWAYGEPVETVMSRHVQTVDAEASALEAAALMLSDRIHHLVVSWDAKPVGIVSSLDLLHAFVIQQRADHGSLIKD